MKTIIAILTILGFAFATFFYIDGHYASSEDVKKIEKRLDYKIVSDQMKSKEDQIWRIKDRFEDKKMDSTTKETLKSLEIEKNELNDKLKALEK